MGAIELVMQILRTQRLSNVVCLQFMCMCDQIGTSMTIHVRIATSASYNQGLRI